MTGAQTHSQATNTIEIEIDGRVLSAAPNQTVIQVADAAGIYIPRFCYHKHLSIPANCRMCLVEMEKSAKPVPACATPVAAGMKIFTRSAKTLAAQRAVMEFLLINHPLDCPICDQGGECELQDLAMGYGSAHSNFNESKQCVADQNLGPLIATEMTRCIKCTRCVRFGEEVAALRELGAIGRGEETDISTYVQHAVQSEVSGNIIDLCPVGALTAKPSRFTARAWELQQAPSISPHDCVGSNLNVHTLHGKVMRVVARENGAVNRTWLADRDRYSYTGLEANDRLRAPLAKIHGEWQTVDWETALQMAAAGLRECIATHGADQLGVLASPNATLEEFYLLQRLTRALGCAHIDHRLRAQDTRDTQTMPLFPGLNCAVTDLAKADAIVLIGSHLQREQPIISLEIIQAAAKGAQIVVINPVDYAFNFAVAAKEIVAPQHMLAALQQLTAALSKKQHAHLDVHSLAAALTDKQQVHILLGALAHHHPDASLIRAETQKLAKLTNGSVGFLTEGANTAGAWLAGAISEREAAGVLAAEPGLNAYAMLAEPRRAYLLLNVEPELDCANPALAEAAFSSADFVVALSIYAHSALMNQANVILPIVPFTETAGTFVNVAGKWQSFKGVAQTQGEGRPAWKVLRVLANFLHLSGFDYGSADEVREEVKAKCDAFTFNPVTATHTYKKATHAELMRVGEVPLYATDSLVRRAQPLQEMQAITDGDLAVLRMHSETAKRLHIKTGDEVRAEQGSAQAILPVVIDDRIAIDAIWIAGGIAATRTLGDLCGAITVERVA